MKIFVRVIEFASLSGEIHEVGVVMRGLNVVIDENINQCAIWLVIPGLKTRGCLMVVIR